MADSRWLRYTSVVVTLIYWQKCNASIFNWPCYRRARHDNLLDHVYVILVSINIRARARYSRSPCLTSTRRCLLRGIFQLFLLCTLLFLPFLFPPFFFTSRHALADCRPNCLWDIIYSSEMEHGSSGERFSTPRRLASPLPTLCTFVNLQSFMIVYVATSSMKTLVWWNNSLAIA